MVSGAAPDRIQRSDDRSYRRRTSGSIPVSLTSWVGTMKPQVTRSRAMSARICSGSKWSVTTTLAPSDIMMRAKAGAALW